MLIDLRKHLGEFHFLILVEVFIAFGFEIKFELYLLFFALFSLISIPLRLEFIILLINLVEISN